MSLEAPVHAMKIASVAPRLTALVHAPRPGHHLGRMCAEEANADRHRNAQRDPMGASVALQSASAPGAKTEWPR